MRNSFHVFLEQKRLSALDPSALENLKSHSRKLGFTPDDKVYYLKHFRRETSLTYHKCDCSAIISDEMHMVALLVKSNPPIAATERNKRHLLYFSRMA